MNSVTVEVDGLRSAAEVLSVTRLESQGRTLITLRSRERLDRGRSCFLHDASGRVIECVISDVAENGTVFVVDLKCIEDPSEPRL